MEKHKRSYKATECSVTFSEARPKSVYLTTKTRDGCGAAWFLSDAYGRMFCSAGLTDTYITSKMIKRHLLREDSSQHCGRQPPPCPWGRKARQPLSFCICAPRLGSLCRQVSVSPLPPLDGLSSRKRPAHAVVRVAGWVVMKQGAAKRRAPRRDL